jgi:hypothetical protein
MLIIVYTEFFGYFSINGMTRLINIENILFDTETKEIAAKCLTHNKPYVRCGAVIGLDGIKKIMASAALKLSGRKNISFFLSKEHAIEWLLQQE